jgi:regulator of protease activity HflC (stomatin/prohibitin superfamily)
MKQHLLLTVAFSLFFFVALNAQEIEYKGNAYEVKGNSILLNGYNVTESLTLDDQRNIRNQYQERAKEFRAKKKAEKAEEKAIAKAEREQEKAQEKAEKQAQGKKKFVIF